MKTVFTFTFCVLFFQASIFAEYLPVDSKINKVTVFLSGAQVKRLATVNLSKGRTELIFKGISPKLDKQSIQVKGDGAFTILSVNHQLNFLEQQKKRNEIEVLLKEKYRLNDEKKSINSLLDVFAEEKNMLAKNQSVGGANTGVVAAELIQAVNFYRERLNAIILSQLKTEKELLKIDSSIAVIDKQLLALNKEKETATSEIVVTVLAKENTTAKFDINYYVLDAGWFATYDLRVRNVDSPMNITFNANVIQQSGENWENVALVISSGNPLENGFVQPLQPWFLTYENNYIQNNRNGAVGKGRGGINSVSGRITDSNGDPLIGASVLVKGSSVGTVTDIDGNYLLNIPADPTSLIISYTGFSSQEIAVNSDVQNIKLKDSPLALSEVVVTGLGKSRSSISMKKSKGYKYDRTIKQQNVQSYQATTINFDIETKYTIPSDGKVRTVEVKSDSISAIYEYYSVPKKNENVYLTALVPEWQALNLFSGEANLFFEEAFLGKSLLDPRNASDTLEISLGVDKGIVIKRNKIRDYHEKRFLGSNKKESRTFEIFVRNNKQEAVRITVEDQFPISKRKEIVVEDLEYAGAKRHKKTEKLIWEFVLEPREERMLKMKYTVKFPKNKYLTLE
ncbi:MAG: mucoidy inhibitor MuiA family protein [Bacteroidota bacterium]